MAKWTRSQSDWRAFHWAALVFGAIAPHFVLVAIRAVGESPTVDETWHLEAAISHWQTSGFDAYPVNPPLVRTLSAVPLLVGAETLDWGTERSLWHMSLARWACIPLSLLGALICFFWARDLFGGWAGVLALALWCFCPNILGYASLITPDIGAAALAVAASYAFWHWLKSPHWEMALLAGTALGLAQLSKMTNLILFGLWPLLWGLWGIGNPARKWAWDAGKLAGILLLALLVLNAGYGFEGSFKPLKNYAFVSETFGGKANREVGNRFADAWLGSLPMPVPENYLRGMDEQRSHFEQGRLSYLRGEYRNEGWWYYYIYALLVKVPLGTWLLGLLAVFFTLWFGVSAGWRNEIMLLAPLVGDLAFVSAQTGFNHHLRYVMAVFPFAFIWIARLASPAFTQYRAVVVLTLLFLGASIYSSMRIYPHSLSYFNELAGGPLNGPKHLLDSNIDWGQDLLFLKKWLDEHPEAKPIEIAYFGSVDPCEIFPQHFKQPESDLPRPGWYAVSVNYIYGYALRAREPNPRYMWFQRLEPVAYAGYSIYIYRLTLREANAVRRQMGLFPLANEQG